MKVTEDGRPVTSLSVQSAAAANGIGTVLLIDSSNSMKGSIDSAMAAARAFTARNPVSRSRSSSSTRSRRRAAVDDGSRPGPGRPREASEARRGHAHLRRPRGGRRAGPGLGARRRPRRPALDGDDVGSVTSLDSALQQLEEQNIRVYTVGIESGAFSAEDLQRIADDTGGEYAAATSPDDLTEVYEELGFRLGNEYLLRYKSGAAPDENVDVSITVDGYGAGLVLLHDPEHGTAAPCERRSRTADAVVGPDPAARPLVIGWCSSRSGSSGTSVRTRRSSHASGEFVTLPPRSAPQSGASRHLLAAAAGQKSVRASAGSRASRRTSTSARSTMIAADC